MRPSLHAPSVLTASEAFVDDFDGAMCCPLLACPPSAGSDGALQLCSPCVSTAAAPLPAYDRGPGRFVGNHYLKCCSPAWMHEWVMIESLRR